MTWHVLVSVASGGWSCQWVRGLDPAVQGFDFFQQRKNSSGVHWCRRRVRFNEVLEKVPKVPEKVWEALVQSHSVSTGFRRRFR